MNQGTCSQTAFDIGDVHRHTLITKEANKMPEVRMNTKIWHNVKENIYD